ncbi:CBS domain-containing protein [Opitutaceae bacterium TAV4]|uniref:IMP dehydrogenase n=1 Tax=Geminisphaera colitermitum TaxID=1148786 RepID=UPI0006949343|nr:IMP dehydrogenase [Geminisphaera colitermitum]RRJ95793.1 CBS domain-containing protein [Opitutaceae bacterium TAV4]RRJ99209.1 CBS domain-containing protein [Opitutaceae bacterium TAV3]
MTKVAPLNTTANATADTGAFDSEYYQPADAFFAANRPIGLTFDDVSLATLYSDILPKDADTSTSLSDALKLSIPIISSDMDTVTEERMAIAMALNGGLGLIHYNMPARDQVKAVARVKRHIHGLIQDPITVTPNQYVADVLDLVEHKRYDFRTFPVVDEHGKLVGLLSGSSVRERYKGKTVAEAMSPRGEIQTLHERQLQPDPIKAADAFFTEHIGIHKMLVVDDNDRLRGLVTFSDIDSILQESRSRRKPARDHAFRLVVGAAIAPVRHPDGTLDRDKIISHVGHLVDESIDAVAVSTAHGHTTGVGDMVKLVRAAFPNLTIIAGNVTSGAGVEFLADCGANAIKVGQGPGSICTTRIVAGVGIPQLTALYVASRAARGKNIKIIADGGITKSGDIVKALTLGDAVILGGLLAGCREAPGEIIDINGKLYKQYRGMGSLSAMNAGSAARYGHDKTDTTRKLTAEGIEALKEVSGSADDVLATLVGGVQSGMGYLGSKDLPTLRQKARYIRVSPAGQKEAAPHDVVEIKTQSNA